MAQTLHPLPQPGLSIYPGFTATKPETFLAKCRNAWSDRASYLISYSSPNGKPLNPFMEIVEEKKNNISFKAMNGQEVMRIIKQEHTWSGAEYHGMRGEGNEVWHLQLKGSWSTEYHLQLYGEAEANQLVVENKLLGADKALGVAWIRTDKQKQDEKAAISAAA
ncbi:hypothetical protein SNOG_05943 [Parastagonospora nodorum SN15]|uniref:Uncharacterized protein n=1 Tax=Phaeosphaeria nodorum (strain SN15 / ATCC MYA-4574 / FGSC 10173) TaxID=321614 RepID=Q0UQM1_PHANO|nr:hypothetical protein SNOG_05943 [Parastagonospora nodorum SN15]EAT87007.1 hypothetical protein SNOG_05943 [Parastagonospora nodorum SN15]